VEVNSQLQGLLLETLRVSKEKKQREKDYWLEEMKTTVKDQACDKYIEEINICDVVNNIKTFRPGC